MIAPTRATAAAVATGDPLPHIYIVDEDPSTLTLMSRVLRARGYAVATFQRADAFLQTHDPDAHGCVIIGFPTVESAGLALLQTLVKDDHHLPVIVVSALASVRTAVQAMRNGAFDFLAPVSEAALACAVEEAIDQDRGLVAARARRAAIEARLATLTASEHLVFSHVMTGHLNRQIADQLGRALKTIKAHRGRAMRKMRAQSAVLLARALERIGPRNLELGSPVSASHQESRMRWRADAVEVD